MERPMTQAEAIQHTYDLFREQDLSGWSLVFNNTKRAAGQCHYSKKIINISRYLMAQRPYEDTLNTITHEVAHALTRGHNHDAVWAAKHRELGGDGQRCFEHEDKNPSPIVGLCPHGKEFARYRMPKRPHVWSCRCPAPSLDGRRITWHRREALAG